MYESSYLKLCTFVVKLVLSFLDYEDQVCSKLSVLCTVLDLKCWTNFMARQKGCLKGFSFEASKMATLLACT